MAKTVLIDQVHLDFYVPRGLPDAACEDVRQVLNDPRFVRKLYRALKEVIRQYPALGEVRFTITR